MDSEVPLMREWPVQAEVGGGEDGMAMVGECARGAVAGFRW